MELWDSGTLGLWDFRVLGSSRFICDFIQEMASIISDPRQDAIAYMEQKNVFKLFDMLGAQLAREKPEDPNEFLLNELKRIKQLKDTGKPVSESSFCRAICV